MARKPKEAERPAPQIINPYGCHVGGLSQMDYERVAFALNTPLEKGGLGKFQHFKNMVSILYPKIEWNDWLELQIRSLCENKWVAWPGCAGAGKTYAACLWATVWWLAWPEESSVILTSTSVKSLRRRAWAEIANNFSSIPGERFGNFVDSQTKWQCRKGDDKHSIFGMAVEEGLLQKAIDNIKGVHTKRQLVIIDEATSTPEAIFEVTANLQSYPEEFQMLVIGNPYSRFDPMGRFCEPKNGWMSVSVDSDEWETVKKIDGTTGICVRFDAEKSPNIVHGKLISKHLITKEKLQAAKDGLGDQNPRYWMEYRGFWPPDGIAKTVFNEVLVTKMDGTGKHIYPGGDMFVVGACDPAFGGGDRAVLRFAKCGPLENGSIGIQLEPWIKLTVTAKDASNDNHYQLMSQIKYHCQKRGCDPRNFALDASGEGGGLCNILGREWSNEIIKVEFGAVASDMPVSLTDSRPCREVYRLKMDELWFTSKDLLLSGQLKGLDPDTIIELCQRLYEDKPGTKIRLESKTDMKKRIGRSPDLADCTVLVCEAAKRNGAVVSGTKITRLTDKRWLDECIKAASVYEGDDSYLHPVDIWETS